MNETVNPRSRFIPWYFVAGMATMLIANGFLIYFATSTWSGLLIPAAYERGLGYNRALAAAEAQEALGWSLDAAFLRQGDGIVLTVRAKDRDGHAIPDLALVAEIERPIEPVPIRAVTLRDAGDGVYAADLPALAPGQWDVKLAASRGGDRMIVTRRLVRR